MRFTFPSPRLPAALLAIVCVAGWAAPAGAADVTPFFDATQRRMVGIANAGAGGRGPGCSALVADVFDLAAIAGAVAAAGNWNAMPPPVRRAMRQAVSARFTRECVSLVGRADPAGARLARVRERADGVRMTVLAPDGQGLDRTVTWTLRPRQRRGWVAVDLEVDGRSAVATLRHEFENALAARQGNVGEAVAHFSGMAQ